jgi:hypothetical protein
MSIHVSGGIELAGLMRVEVTVATIQPEYRIVLKGVSGPLKGTIIVSEIVRGVGFGLSSTSPDDVGQTVYFDVVEVEKSQ